MILSRRTRRVTLGEAVLNSAVGSLAGMILAVGIISGATPLAVFLAPQITGDASPVVGAVAKAVFPAPEMVLGTGKVVLGTPKIVLGTGKIIFPVGKMHGFCEKVTVLA